MSGVDLSSAQCRADALKLRDKKGGEGQTGRDSSGQMEPCVF